MSVPYNTKNDFRKFITEIKSNPHRYTYVRGTLDKFKNNNFDLSTQTYKGKTLLHYAVKLKSLKLCQIFLEYGVNPNVATDNGITPLHQAISLGRLDFVKLLLDNGSDIYLPSEFEQSPLHLAVISGNLDIVKYLLLKGADLNIADERNLLPIDYAIDEKDLDMVEFLSKYQELTENEKERIGALNERNF